MGSKIAAAFAIGMVVAVAYGLLPLFEKIATLNR